VSQAVSINNNERV